MNAVQTEPKCVVCGGSTELGMVADRSNLESLSHRPEWWPGTPDEAFFGGFKRPQGVRKVVTRRCTGCGYLMSFAS